jgi:maltose-binding protein MalE
MVQPCATATSEAETGLPTTIQLVAPATEAVGPSGLGAAPGVTVALADNPDFAQCPVDALESADGPVRITFWHAMQSAQGDALAELTEQYNASQDRVVVELQNQNGYEELIDKYFQSSTEDRPHVVQMPEYMLQQMADANTVITTTACIQAGGYDISPFLPRAMFAYQTGGVQWGMPLNISSPVLYYNKAMFEEAGLDPEDPPRRPTASPSTPASTRVAPGSSSSGSPVPGFPTPTTTTAAPPAPRRCCSTRPRVSRC